jgi:hypothetical protein
MNPGEKVIDFAAFNERGNVIALTESNKIVGYKNGLKKWERQLSGEVKLKSCSFDRKFVCVFNKNESQLIDMHGKTHFNFVSSIPVPPESYTLKSKQEFLVVTSPTNFAIINDKGSSTKQFSSVGKIKEIAVQKTKNGSQLAMILTDKMLYSIDLAKRKTTFKSQVDSLYQLAKDETGIYAITYDKGNLNIVNFQGKKSSYAVGNFIQDFKILSASSGVNIILKKQKSIAVFDLFGKRIWTKNLNLNEITELSVYENSNGKKMIAVLDGIENELYLLDGFGNFTSNTSKHGEQKLELSSFGARGFSITTFLGNYLIQYNN